MLTALYVDSNRGKDYPDTMQSSRTILVVEPACFRRNEDTAVDNTFQEARLTVPNADLQELAHEEFIGFRHLLSSNGVEVVSYKDLGENDTPDSIFPNNWFSTHREDDTSTLVLYPLKAENRRRERRPDIISELKRRYENVIDLVPNEAQGIFLEATGSLVLDRVNRVAYAALSERTDPKLGSEWAEKMRFDLELFTSLDGGGRPIYHTNVLMSIGTGYAVIGAETITNVDERDKVLARLRRDGHAVVELTLDQLQNFCGNVLEVTNKYGEKLLAMSSKAYDHFTSEQRDTLSKFARLIHAPLDTIERFGGGGARCMMGEIF